VKRAKFACFMAAFSCLAGMVTAVLTVAVFMADGAPLVALVMMPIVTALCFWVVPGYLGHALWELEELDRARVERELGRVVLRQPQSDGSVVFRTEERE
jgi:fatty acid desaturase